MDLCKQRLNIFLKKTPEAITRESLNIESMINDKEAMAQNTGKENTRQKLNPW